MVDKKALPLTRALQFGAKLQSSSAVLRFNFCTKLKIFASIAPPSQGPETLSAILKNKTAQNMNFFKKIFGSKSEPQNVENSEFIIVTLNDKIQPIDRGDYYEDPLEEYLQKNEIGEITGGGTMQAENGEIEFVDIEIELKNGVNAKEAAKKIIGFLKSKSVPKNSKLKIEKTEAIINFGDKEGFAIYLDGRNLADDVYQNCDSNFVVSEIKKLIGDNSEIVRFWELPEKTALYFYGNSFEEMTKQINAFVNEYPLCRNAEIKQIA